MSFINSFAALAAAALMSGAVITGAEAADRHYGGGFAESKARLAIVNARISNQKRRIRFGLRTRRLNWIEARRLRFELSHIRGFRARYMRDGWMSRFEKRHLDRLLDQNSRRIRRLATNGWQWRNRGGRGDRYGRQASRRLGHLNGFGTF